ncbi:hypothetical protein ABPG72_012404 [Tetrahymena utriculariae]
MTSIPKERELIVIYHKNKERQEPTLQIYAQEILQPNRNIISEEYVISNNESIRFQSNELTSLMVDRQQYSQNAVNNDLFNRISSLQDLPNIQIINNQPFSMPNPQNNQQNCLNNNNNDQSSQNKLDLLKNQNTLFQLENVQDEKQLLQQWPLLIQFLIQQEQKVNYLESQLKNNINN